MVFIVSGKLPECLADSDPPKIRQTSTKVESINTGGRRLNGESEEQSHGDQDLDAAIKLSLEAFTPTAPNADELRQRRLAFFAKPPDTK